MDIDLIFKIAAVGILTAVVNQVLKKADKAEIATLTTLAGLVIVLLMVIDMIAQLFDSLKMLFTFYYFMEIFRIAAIGIITALCVLVLRENRSDIATLIGITGGVIILLSLIDYFTQIFDFLRRFIEKTGIDGSVIKALVKIVGIGKQVSFQ